MVISLPSVHAGGDVVVKQDGRTKMFKTSSEDASLLCWYSGVHHKVLPVTSGYRWALTYNLTLFPDHERPSAGLLRQDDLQPLRQALNRRVSDLERGQSTPEHLYYRLHHHYTEAQISLDNLKTTDYAQVSALQQVSAEIGLGIFLAVLELEEGYVSKYLLWNWFGYRRHVDSRGRQILSKTYMGDNREENTVQNGEPLQGSRFEKDDDVRQYFCPSTLRMRTDCYQASTPTYRCNIIVRPADPTLGIIGIYILMMDVARSQSSFSEIVLPNSCENTNDSDSFEDQDRLIGYFAGRCSIPASVPWLQGLCLRSKSCHQVLGKVATRRQQQPNE